jgi:hypothetical protein
MSNQELNSTQHLNLQPNSPQELPKLIWTWTSTKQILSLKGLHRIAYHLPLVYMWFWNLLDWNGLTNITPERESFNHNKVMAHFLNNRWPRLYKIKFPSHKLIKGRIFFNAFFSMCPLINFPWIHQTPKNLKVMHQTLSHHVLHCNASNINLPHVSPRLCTIHVWSNSPFMHQTINVSYHGDVGLTLRGRESPEYLHWTWIYKNFSYLEQVPYFDKSHILRLYPTPASLSQNWDNCICKWVLNINKYVGLYPTHSSLSHYLDNYLCKWLLTI